MTSLKRCPCGEVPEELIIRDGDTHAFKRISGSCCARWTVELVVATVGAKATEEAVYKSCKKAWNDAPRGTITTSHCQWQ
jgi:hypothetical protein